MKWNEILPFGLIMVIFSEDAKILVMSGTHGTEDGVSALTELEAKILICSWPPC